MSMEDAISALEAILRAMQVADKLVQEAADEHHRAFAFQMREKIGAESIALDEPYLESERARFQLQFVKVMERLFGQIEKYIPENSKGQEAKSGDFASHEPAKRHAICRADLHERSCEARSEWRRGEAGAHLIENKSINPKDPLTPQTEERIAIETVRLTRRLKQSLDGKRQRAYGLRRYIWRSQDDSKVRASHTANDDKVFDWDSPPPTGHPGAEFGCRCWAEPLAEGADEPLPEGVEVAVLINPATVEVAIIIANAVDKLNKARKALQAARAADALLNEIPQQQEEEGALDAPQPPTLPTPEPPEEEPEDDLFQRPEGVPEEWEEKPSDKKEGTKYVDPNDRGNDVRIQKGDPDAKWPSQRKDYVRWKRNGQWLDKDGKPVADRYDPRGHIPIEEFEFDPEIFK